MDRNIYIVGITGSGKSTVGGLLASRLVREFVDLDSMIERESGMSVCEIFDEKGEKEFREIEAEALKRVAGVPGMVVSVGGGCVLSKHNRDVMLKTGRVIYLKIDAATAAERIGKNLRKKPLLRDCLRRSELRSRIQKIMRQRGKYYAESDIELSTGGKTPAQVVDAIIHKLNHTDTIRVSLPGQSYNVKIGDGILSNIDTSLGALYKAKAPRNVFILVDSRLHDDSIAIASSIRSLGWQVNIICLKVSEKIKDFKGVYPIYGKLHEMGADRESIIIGLGGGVVGDLAGFIAATYLRGVEWISIPTTLLSQVDSSVGGKTGINHEAGKNLIGAFHQPSMVICDLSFLKTLSRRDVVSGLAEMVKCGLICDSSLYGYLCSNWKSILEVKSSAIRPCVEKCVRMKGKIIERDEFDVHGIRETLNFGHTFGHALENITNYRCYRHGEALIWGMRFAIVISLIKGRLPRRTAVEIDNYLRLLPTPKIPDYVSEENIISAMGRDKKRFQNNIHFVLLSEIGEAIPGIAVSRRELSHAFKVIIEGGIR